MKNLMKDFPEELIPVVLIRLPIKSLIRCTSVCKSWRSMIKDPTFIRTHLTHTLSFNTQNATHLLLLHTVNVWFKKDLYSLCYDNPAFDQYCNFEFPNALKKVTDDRACRVVGTCNGLVCLADDLGRYVSNLLIWNPAVRKYVTLPNPLGGYGCASFGLGYDSVTNDYKVVRLATQLDVNNKLYECPPVAQVYSLAKGSWSSLYFDLPPCLMAGCSPNAFVNGALHWLAFRLTNDAYVYFVLSFEVSSGSFRQITLPESFKLDISFGLSLSVSGDGKSLGLFAKCNSDTGSFLDIWVMRENCMEKSWTKMMILSPQGPKRSLHQALCFRKSGEVVLVLEDDRELVSLDLVSKKFKSLGISRGQLCSVDSYSHMKRALSCLTGRMHLLTEGKNRKVGNRGKCLSKLKWIFSSYQLRKNCCVDCSVLVTLSLYHLNF